MPARILGAEALKAALLRELAALEGKEPSAIEQALSVEQTTTGISVTYRGRTIDVNRLVPLPVRINAGGDAMQDFGIIASWGPRSRASVAIHPEIVGEKAEQLQYIPASNLLANALHLSSQENIPIPAAIQRLAGEKPQIEGSPSNFSTLVSEATTGQATRMATAISMPGVHTLQSMGAIQEERRAAIPTTAGAVANLSPIIANITARGLKEGRGGIVAYPTYLAKNPVKTSKYVGSAGGRQGVAAFTIATENVGRGVARKVLGRPLQDIEDVLTDRAGYRPVLGTGIKRSFEGEIGQRHNLMVDVLFTGLPGYPGAGLLDPRVLETEAGEQIRFGYTSMEGGKSISLHPKQKLDINTLLGHISGALEEIASGNGGSFVESKGYLRGAGEMSVLGRIDLGPLGEVTSEVAGTATGYAPTGTYKLSVPWFYDPVTGELSVEKREGFLPIEKHPEAAEVFAQLKGIGIFPVRSDRPEIALHAEVFKESEGVAFKQLWGGKTAATVEAFRPVIEAGGALMELPGAMRPQLVTADIKMPGLAALNAAAGRLKKIGVPTKGLPGNAAARQAALVGALSQSGALGYSEMTAQRVTSLAERYGDIFEAYYGKNWQRTLQQVMHAGRAAGGFLKDEFYGGKRFQYLDFGSAFEKAAELGYDPSIISRYEQAVGDIYLRNVLQMGAEKINEILAPLDELSGEERQKALPGLLRQAWSTAENYALTYGVAPISEKMGAALRLGRPREYTPGEQIAPEDERLIQEVFGGDRAAYERALQASSTAQQQNIEFLSRYLGGKPEETRAWLNRIGVSGIYFKSVPMVVSPEYFGKARLNLEDLTTLQVFASNLVNEDFAKEFIANMLGSSTTAGPFGVEENAAYRGWRSMIAGYVATSRGWGNPGDIGGYEAGIAPVDEELATKLYSAMAAVEGAGEADYKQMLYQMQDILGENTNLLAFRFGGKTAYLPSPAAIVGAAYDPEAQLGERGAAGLLRQYHSLVRSLLFGTMHGTEYEAQTAYSMIRDFYDAQLMGKVSGAQLNRLLGTMAEASGAYSARYQISYNLAPGETYIPRHRLQSIARTYGFRNASEMFSLVAKLGGEPAVVGLRQPNIGFSPVPLRIVPSSEMTQRYYHSYLSLGYSAKEAGRLAARAMRVANTMQLVGPGLAEAGQGDYDYDPMSIFPAIPKMSDELRAALRAWNPQKHGDFSQFIASGVFDLRGTSPDSIVEEYGRAKRYVEAMSVARGKMQTPEDYVGFTVPKMDMAAYSEFAKSIAEAGEQFQELNALASGEMLAGPSGKFVEHIGAALSGGWRGKGESPMGVTYNARRIALLAMQASGVPKSAWLRAYQSTTPLYQHTLDVENLQRGGLVRFAYPFLPEGSGIGIRTPQVGWSMSPKGRNWQMVGDELVSFVDKVPQERRFPDFANRMKRVLSTAASLLIQDVFPSPEDVPKGFSAKSGWSMLTTLIAGHTPEAENLDTELRALYEQVYGGGKLTKKRMLNARADAHNIIEKYISGMTPEQVVSAPASSMFMGSLFTKYFPGDERAKSFIDSMLAWTADSENMPHEMRQMMARGAIIGAAQHVWTKHADVSEMPKIAGIVAKAVEALGGIHALPENLQWTAKALMAGQVPITDAYAGEKEIGFRTMAVRRGSIPVRHLAGLVTGSLFESEKASLVGRAIGVPVRAVTSRAMRRGNEAEAYLTGPAKGLSAIALGEQTLITQSGAPLSLDMDYFGGKLRLTGIADVLAFSRGENGEITGVTIADIKARKDNTYPKSASGIKKQYLAQVSLYEKMLAGVTPDDIRKAFPSLSAEEAEKIHNYIRGGNARLGIMYATKRGDEWIPHTIDVSEAAKPYREMSIEQLLSIAGENWGQLGLPTTQTGAVEFLRSMAQRGIIKIDEAKLSALPTAASIRDKAIEEIVEGKPPTPEEIRRSVQRTIGKRASSAQSIAEEAIEKAASAGGAGAPPPSTPPPAAPLPPFGGEGSGPNFSWYIPHPQKGAGVSPEDIGTFAKQAAEHFFSLMGEKGEEPIFAVGYGSLGKYIGQAGRFYMGYKRAVGLTTGAAIRAALGLKPDTPLTMRHYVEAAAQAAGGYLMGNASPEQQALVDSGFVQAMIGAAGAFPATSINNVSRLTDTDKDLFVAGLSRVFGMDTGTAAELMSSLIEQYGENRTSPLGVLGVLAKDFGLQDVKIPKALQRAVNRVSTGAWRFRANRAMQAIRGNASALGLGETASVGEIVSEALRRAESGNFESDDEAAAVRDILKNYAWAAKMPGVRQIGEAEREQLDAIRENAERAIGAYNIGIGAKTRKLYSAYRKYIGNDLAKRADDLLKGMKPEGMKYLIESIGDEKLASAAEEYGYDYDAMFGEGGLNKKYREKIRSHVKRTVAHAALRQVPEAQEAVREYEELDYKKRIARGVAENMPIAEELATAQEQVAPESAREALGDLTPPSVQKAFEQVRIASERMANVMSKYTDTLEEAVQHHKKTGKASKELAEKLAEMRKQIGRLELEKQFHELGAQEEQARFGGNTEKAERLRWKRQTIRAKLESGVDIETSTTRELAGIEEEYSIKEPAGLKEIAARFARGFALFYAMRIWRVATGELMANMQEGEAWAKSASAAAIASGGVGMVTPGEHAAEIAGAGFSPYSGLVEAKARIGRVTGPIPAILSAAAGTYMGVGVMKAMGFESMGGIFGKIAGMEGGPLALAATGMAILGGASWLYGTSQDDYLPAKYLATNPGTLGGTLERFWYQVSAGLNNALGGSANEQVYTALSAAITPGTMSISGADQFAAQIKKVVGDNRDIFGGLSSDAIAVYSTRIRQAGLIGAPNLSVAGSTSMAEQAYYNYLRSVGMAAKPLAWAAEQKIPLESVAMAMLPSTAGASDVLSLSRQMAVQYGYGTIYTDPEIERVRQQRSQALMSILPREYIERLPMEQRMKLQTAARTTEGENAQLWKMWAQGWSRARQLGIEGWYKGKVGGIEDFVKPMSGPGGAPIYVPAPEKTYQMMATMPTEQRLGQIQGWMSAAGFSWTDYSQFAQQFAGMSNAEQYFTMGAMQWRPIPLTAFAYQNNIPELAVSDVNNQGELTGLPLWTTSFQLPGISGSQLAAQIWGADWEKGDISGVRHAMVQSGFRGVQYQMMALRAQQARESAGIAAARAHLQYVFTTGRGLGAYGAEFAKSFTWSIPGIGSFNGGSGFWGYEGAMFALQTAQQRYQFGIQQQRMNLNEQYWQANYGMNYQQFQAGMEYTQNMWGLQDTQRALQFGWRISDIRENMQFATGRQRMLLERQLKRETTMYSLGEEQIQNQREYQETLWDIQKRRFEEEKEHHQKMMALQRDEFEKAKQFFETRVRLEEQYRKLRHKYYEEQYKLQLAQIGNTQKWAKIMEQAQKDLQKVKDAQEDQLAKAKVLQAMYPTLLDYLDKLGRKWQELILDPMADMLGVPRPRIDTNGVGGGGGGNNRRLPQQRAAGGLVLPGENILHAGEVVVKNKEPLMVVPAYQRDDFMAKYYATHSGNATADGGNISATITVVLATEGLRQLVRQVVHEEVSAIR